MKKILAVTISSLFLVACGSDNADKSNITEPSLAEISGVWDMTRIVTEEQVYKDIAYMVIKDHGELIIYDYQGDSMDQGEGCYYKFSETITDLGNGSFEVSEYDGEFTTSKLSISNNELTITIAPEIVSFPKSSLQESEFIPLCDEVTTNLSALKSSIANKTYQFINRE